LLARPRSSGGDAGQGEAVGVWDGLPLARAELDARAHVDQVADGRRRVARLRLVCVGVELELGLAADEDGQRVGRGEVERDASQAVRLPLSIRARRRRRGLRRRPNSGRPRRRRPNRAATLSPYQGIGSNCVDAGRRARLGAAVTLGVG